MTDNQTHPACDMTCKTAVCDCDEYSADLEVDLAIAARRARLKASAMRICEEYGIGQPAKPKTTTTNPMREQTDMTNPDTRIILTLPIVFWRDHEDRGLVSSSGTYVQYVVGYKAKKIVVSLSVADALELLSDAEYYSDTSMGWEWELQYLVSSARATVNAINKQWPTAQRPASD